MQGPVARAGPVSLSLTMPGTGVCTLSAMPEAWAADLKGFVHCCPMPPGAWDGANLDLVWEGLLNHSFSQTLVFSTWGSNFGCFFSWKWYQSEYMAHTGSPRGDNWGV